MDDDAPCPYVRGTPEGTRWCALAADDTLRQSALMALFELTEISAGTVDALPGCDQTRLLDAIDALRKALKD